MVLRFLSRSCAYAQVVTSSSICVLKGEMILARSASSFVDHVINAGRLVGYPPSLLNLKHLFGEEMSYLASHLKRLIGSKHPVVTTAREVLLGSIESVHIHGIVVLLVSKLVNLCPPRIEVRDHIGITDAQRSLSEITERVQAAHMIHLSLVDLCRVVREEEEMRDMDFGNKISILSGDLLLAKACVGLAELDCPQVVDTMSKAISDMMVGTAHMYNEEGYPLSTDQPLPPVQSGSPSSTGSTAATLQKAHLHTASHLLSSSTDDCVFLMNGSLLAHSCKAAAILAQRNEDVQNRLFSFATNFSLARQIIRSKTGSEHEDDVIAAQNDNFLRKSHHKVDTRDMFALRRFVSRAVSDLSYFPANHTRQVLTDIVTSVVDSSVVDGSVVDSSVVDSSVVDGSVVDGGVMDSGVQGRNVRGSNIADGSTQGSS